MTFRQILNRLQAAVSEELTEDDILDMDIRVTIPASMNMKTTDIGVEQCYIHTDSYWSQSTGKVEIKRRFVAIDTNLAT